MEPTPSELERIGSLMAVLVELIDTPTAQSRGLIEQHPELLSAEAEGGISNLLRLVDAQGNEAMAQSLRERLDLLRRCRELGIDEAFAGMAADESEVPAELSDPIRRALELEDDFGTDSERTHLDEAIEIWEGIFRDPSFESSSEDFRIGSINDAARLYLIRHEQFGDAGDLQHAVSAFEQVVAGAPPEASDLPMYLTNLGNALRDRFFLDRMTDDLARAIEAFDRAVALTPTEAPELPYRLDCLGDGRFERYLRGGSVTDLEAAIASFEKALEASRDESPAQAGILNNLGRGLMERYVRQGESADLQACTAAYESALGQISPDSPDVAALLNNLGRAALEGYALEGAVDQLEQAITRFEQAVNLTPAGAPDLPSRLANLGIALRKRFARAGALADLDRAIGAHEDAVELTPDVSPDRPARLSNLANAILDRYAYGRDPQELDRAIAISEDAVASAPPGSPYLPNWRSTLGIGLRQRYARSRSMRDLEQAIGAFRCAAQETARDAPTRHVYSSNLAVAVRDRYERTGALRDLDEAIVILKETLGRTPPHSPDRPGMLVNLGGCLRERYRQTRRDTDAQAAVAAYAHAAEQGQGLAVGAALQGARGWMELAFSRKRWADVAKAYRYAYQAGEQLVRLQLRRSSKETWLQESRGLAAQAAYALAKTGDLDGAAVALERGRARLLSDVLERDRAELKRLHDIGEGALAERYGHAAAHWQALARRELRPDDEHPTDATLIAALGTARAELDEAIASIRRVPGYASFLRAPELSEVLAAARPRPLVYVVATNDGGLALIVRGDVRPQVVEVWLPRLTEDALATALGGPDVVRSPGGYLGAYGQSRDDPRDAAAHKRWMTTLDDTTRWLWHAFMGTLLVALEADTEITLVPTGLLGLLPLHAAWTEDPSTPTGRRYALDSLVICYAPNARAVSASADIARRDARDRLLAVIEPMPVEAGALPSAAQEVSTAVACFPDARVLSGRQAGREAVRDALPGHDVFHFACHGYANVSEPLRSGLVMAHNDVLDLGELMDLRLEGARLAVLSACETGMMGAKLPDEVLSLASGLLQSRVAGVVASLWSVADNSTALLMFGFYYAWRHKNMEPMCALAWAQRWLRDTTNEQKREFFDALLVDAERNGFAPDAAEYFGRELAASKAQARGYEHPFHWAAFGYTGA